MKLFRSCCIALLLSSSHFLVSAFSPAAQARPFVRSHSPSRRYSSSLQIPQEEDTSTPEQRDSTIVLAEDVDFVKPLVDSRKYRAVKLPNGLEVLLVSSEQDDVEAAALHVSAGHLDDARPGLAHFHEHMLFLGTKKYPFPEEYEQYLNTHGGSSNAYTDMEDTNYYLSVTPSTNDTDKVSSALYGALDRFAQFFIAPTFDPSMVERELRAIDSEYRNGLTSDAWRLYSLLKKGSSQDHPFSNFGCGNYETLSQDPSTTSLQQDLWEFWQSHYQTNNMRLAVVSRAPLDALQTCVEQTFGQLPQSTGTPLRGKQLPSTSSLFATEHAQYTTSPDHVIKAFSPDNELGVIRETIPLLETHLLKLYFATPPLDDPVLKESKPHRVISHLLGHESPGSLHSLLNQKGWLTGLSSGTGIDTSDFSLFTLTLSLTPEGMRHRQEVLDLVFEWISLVQNTSDETLQQYHEELRQISSTNFRYRENGDPTNFCSSAAELLFDYPPEKLLVGASTCGEFSGEIARAFLDRLKPENCLITVIDSELKQQDDGEWKTEPWYGAKYRDTRITSEQAREWSNPTKIDPQLHLPGLNQYIPTDFSLKCDAQKEEPTTTADDDDDLISLELEPPTLLTLPDNTPLRMWFKMDRYWRVPKTYIRLSLQSPNVYMSPRTMTLNRIFQRMLNDDLNECMYDANVAGCTYRVACVPSGYRILIRGYSEKLPFVLDTLTTRILSLIDEMKRGEPSLIPKFEKAKNGLLRETKNFRLDAPYEVASYNSRLLMEESVWYVQNYIDEMEGPQAERNPLTVEECARVAEESLVVGRVKAEALCIGNIDEDDATKVADVVDRHFLKESRPLLDVETPLFRSMKLPTHAEAVSIFGDALPMKSIPLVYQELAFSESEENNAVELILQAGCDQELGYEGVAILDLISHIAYNSAYNQLRTVEQLGYIASSSTRKLAGGAWALSTVVQSSVVEPEKLEERIEAWLVQFRKELQNMDPQSIAKEAAACVAQLLERDTKLSQEVGHVWSEIIETESLSDALKEPAFDKMEQLAEELMVCDDDGMHANGDKHHQTATELKQKVLDFFDKYLSAASPERRALSSRVYSQKSKEAYDEGMGKPGILSDHSDIFHLKQFLSTWPLAPYWTKQANNKR